MQVVYEDNHLLAVLKPYGLPTMGARPGIDTLLHRAKQYVATKYDKPGNVYLGIVSRLDAPVTGVVLIARTSKAAARLNAAFRDRRVEKSYLAIVEQGATPQEGRLEHFLRKDERHRKVHVTTPQAADSIRAELTFRTLASHHDQSLLLVKPITGRKHQIRVQLAKEVGPIVGDRKYGARVELRAGIRLHAWQLRLEHPVRRTPLKLSAPLPSDWPAWSLSAAGGQPPAV